MSRTLSVGTANLLNLNLPGRAMYGRAGWSEDVYERKVAWTAAQLRAVPADVWGVQEVWSRDALDAVVDRAELAATHQVLMPPGHTGTSIACGALVRTDWLVGDPVWISTFPDAVRIESEGDDPQTPEVAVNLGGFSRPVLRFRVRPRDDAPPIVVFVAHLKSKRPTELFREGWYNADRDRYRLHLGDLGRAVSAIRRVVEAAALRVLLNEATEGAGTPAIVLGDLNGGPGSDVIATLTRQPRHALTGEFYAGGRGGSDKGLYSVEMLHQARSFRDLAYTYIHNEETYDSLDHILVSEEFFDYSSDRIWALDGFRQVNDHLHQDEDEQAASGATDHALVVARFTHAPRRS